MVPAAVLFLDDLPRTRNGKVDRGALPAPKVAALAEPTGPEGSIEDRVLAIWRAVLRSPTVSAEDEFFDAGGTSITALNAISRARKEFGVPVRLAVLFDAPTVVALADEVRRLRVAQGSEEQS